jgi:hypothetical protein
LAEGQSILRSLIQDLDQRVTTLENVNAFVVVTATPFTAGDEGIILVDDDTVGGPVTVNLPPVADRSTPYFVKKLGTTGNVVIDGDGTEPIDNALTRTIGIQYSVLRISPGSGVWWVT